jgi:5-aminolevulinate synthase
VKVCEEIFTSKIKGIKEEGRYREFMSFAALPGNLPYIMNYERNMEVVVWCNNNYLGMVQNENVVSAIRNSSTQVGTGGTRNISGTTK